jgi:ATP-dependent DNA ligase
MALFGRRPLRRVVYGQTIFEHACKLGFEGIVSKNRAHPYRSGTSKSWIKVKNPKAPGVLRLGRRAVTTTPQRNSTC